MKKPPKRKPKHKSGRGPAAPVTARAAAAKAPGAAAKAKSAASASSATIGAVVGSLRDQVRHAFTPARPGRDAHLARVARHMMQHPPEHGAAVAHSQSAAAVYAPDERQALALLLLPFLLLAAGIGINQSLRYANRLPELAAPEARPADARPTVARPAEPRPVPSQAELIRATPRVHIGQAPAPSPLAAAGLPQLAGAAPAPTVVAALSPKPAQLPSSSAPSALSSTRLAPSLAPAPRDVIATLGASNLNPAVVAALSADRAPPAAASAATAPPTVPPASPAPAVVESLTGPASRLLPVPPTALGRASVAEDAPLDLLERPQPYAAHFPPGGICTPPATQRTAALPVALVQGEEEAGPANAGAFGRALATAARRQLSDLVVYTDRYRRISFPMGDVSPLYGVCTDVVIRAYRDLGLDLQALVHQTRIGSGDTSIDHRRVDTLRRFFATFGQALPVTDFAEDYKPGDIVSYYRPQNRHSRTHIAIVSDEIGPSGRPMIIHNRGWGPQIEDGLFVDEITGHYRFSGIGARQPAAPGETGSIAATRAKVGPVRRVSAHVGTGENSEANASAGSQAKRREARSTAQPISR